jgi:tRNA modification GTPase
VYTADTIAAIATASGPGGVGIVRVSGARAADIGRATFRRSGASDDWQSHRLYHGRVVDADGTTLDEGLAVLMRGPRSFTGEDVLELHCHAGAVVLRRVLGRVLVCGARLAEPGEFTRRAFLNGRMDLAQAEAVLDLVRARTTAGATLAAQQLVGRLSDHLAGLRDDLLALKALLEVQIDFADEDVAVEPDRLRASLATGLERIELLVQSFDRGRLVRDGVRVAIIGKPNVGKSSLLNALLGEERAIVTPVAGTTRDAIDETADFDGVPVVLSDTAGLRPVADADAVERIGMQRTVGRVDSAHVVLAVLDASRAVDAEDYAVFDAAHAVRTVVVLNKSDLPPVVTAGDLQGRMNGAPVVTVSARTGAGLNDVRRAVLDRVAACPVPDDTPTLTSVRHVDTLSKAAVSLRLALAGLAERQSPELVAVDVQDAIDHIGEVTGLITTEDVLDRVFREFCIGK